MDNLLPLLAGRQWIPLSAILIGFLVRLLKDDTRLLPTVPARYRRHLAFGLGCVAGVLQMVGTGSSWKDALATAVLGPVIAIAGHHLGVDLLRGGREVPIPGFMKSS
jgi:hypothetical protein